MNRKAITALTVIVIGMSISAARAELIDPEFKVVQDKMKAEEAAECPAYGPRHLRCFEQILRDYRNRGLMRGTPEYIDQHYGALSAQELNQQIVARNKFFGQTRGSSLNLKPGEITSEMMSIEVSELHHLIDLKGGARALQ